jgi:hypothetical protein
MTNTNEQFETRVKNSLNSSVSQLDADTQQRLNQARKHALNQAQSTTWFSAKYWVPASSLVFGSIAAVFFFMNGLHVSYLNNPTMGTNAIDQTAMIEVIQNPEDADTLTDPTFYLWLNEAEKGHAV